MIVESPQMCVVPKVSVAMITFNHAAYIEQAVRSALAQVASFPYEVVVGDDCSTDGTCDILLRLQGEFPDKLRLILREQNLGLLGKKNLVATFKECRGEYLAYLEGDDYWDAEDKLQRQADHLDANPQLVGCCHEVRPLRVGEPLSPRGSGVPSGVIQLDLTKLFRFGFPHLMSMMCRRRSLAGFPEWFYQVSMGDWSLWSLLLSQGPVASLKGWPVGVYRIHAASYWLGKPLIERTVEEIRALEVFLEVYPPEHHPALWKRINARQFWLVDAYLEAGQPQSARGAFWAALKSWPKHRGETPRKIAQLFLRAHCRPLLHALRQMRKRPASKRPS